MEFSRSGKGILVNQRKYALEIISQLGIGSAKPSWTPLETSIKITTHELDNLIGESDEELLENKEQPDIAFSVQTLSQFLQQPKKSHWEAALRVMKYVKREPGLGILLSSTRTNRLTVFCDADWASCPNTRRSVSGFLVKHGNSLISWKSKKQSVVSRSSAKAEYRSMANEVSEVVWITTLLKELGSELDEPYRKTVEDVFEIIFPSNNVKRYSGSIDCELYLAAYAEYLTDGQLIPLTNYDVNLHRSRYSALL
uniref:Reverse transcriptase Ty1/copia-type domain-containing protein n=1 Tax=Solanum lycopersicum TaxID=4081 RepID=A0A3Q7J616_SOLLC